MPFVSNSSFEHWQSALIHELRVARLGTIGPTGLPHLVPVCYALVDGRVFIPVDEKPKSSRNLARLRNIERDPHVSLLFDRYDDDWTQLAWVRIDGIATVAERGDSNRAALSELRARYHQYDSMELESAPLVSVAPLKLTAWRWSK